MSARQDLPPELVAARRPVGREPLLELVHVGKRFTRRLDLAGKLLKGLGAPLRETVVHALDGVSLRIRPGEVLGLVGESGCGKSTLARIAAGIQPPTDGDVLWRGQNVARLRGRTRRDWVRGVQLVFQDPMASLNPRLRVERLIGEAPLFHGLIGRAELADRVDAAMQEVGLDPTYKRRFPHQFSGGQRQRIGIARALAVLPELLVCDEPVAALDVSIQAQIINLFLELRDRLGLTFLFISHDLGVVEHLADQVVIMYLGRIVETAPAEAFFAAPQHPYAQTLLAGITRLDRRRTAFTPPKGETPSPLNPPPGCHFHPRCPRAFARCRTEAPTLREIAPGRMAACHLHDAR